MTDNIRETNLYKLMSEVYLIAFMATRKEIDLFDPEFDTHMARRVLALLYDNHVNPFFYQHSLSELKCVLDALLQDYKDPEFINRFFI